MSQTTTPPAANHGAAPAGGAAAGCPCPTDFTIPPFCKILSVGGSLHIPTAEIPGTPAGTYAWTSPSPHIRILAEHSPIAMVLGVSAGAGRDAEVITVTRTAPGCPPITKTVTLTVAKVVFSKSPNQTYGYDDFDTPANTDDDHISVKKLDQTFVKVDITGGAIGTDFDFICTVPATCTVAAPPGSASFDLQLTGGDTNKAATALQAKVKCTPAAVFATIQVHVYKEFQVDVVVGKFHDSRNAATALAHGGEDYSTANALINPKAKEAVVKYNVTNYDPAGGQTDVPFDNDTNGCLTFDINNNGGAELTLIRNAMTGTGTKTRIAIVKCMKSYYYLAAAAPVGATVLTITGGVPFAAPGRSTPLGSGATQENVTVASNNATTMTLSAPTTKAHAAGEGIEFPAAGWSSDPIIIVEGTTSVEDIKWTFFHETGHRKLTLKDSSDSDTIMYFQQAWADHRLRYCPRQLNYGAGAGKENQWELVPRT